MDYETADAPSFGTSLTGMGLNILVRDVRQHVEFLTCVFDMNAHQVSDNFAIITYHEQVFQLHSDGTYASHPLLALLPENPPRGAGIEIRLYQSDPDLCHSAALKWGADVLHPPVDKPPHGLRECSILSPDGYIFVSSRHL